ncbi:hypothetical protein [Parvibaculum sp.]|uniref:hypothetical protein n=1 Tax=Parvibaculum sp. TaxID=2024848 RepID=UPI003BAD5F9C
MVARDDSPSDAISFEQLALARCASSPLMLKARADLALSDVFAFDCSAQKRQDLFARGKLIARAGFA